MATGAPHRVVIDLDASAWWIEAPPEQAREFAAEPPPARVSRSRSGSRRRWTGRQFAPLAGPFGRPRQLPADVFFASIETLAAGPVATGQVGIVFEEDGTADPALFLLENEEGVVVSVRIARLADEVQIRRE